MAVRSIITTCIIPFNLHVNLINNARVNKSWYNCWLDVRYLIGTLRTLYHYCKWNLQEESIELHLSGTGRVFVSAFIFCWISPLQLFKQPILGNFRNFKDVTWRQKLFYVLEFLSGGFAAAFRSNIVKVTETTSFNFCRQIGLEQCEFFFCNMS